MAAGRTPLFREVMRALQRARWREQTPAERERLRERQRANAFSRRDFVRLLGAAGIAATTGAGPGWPTRSAAQGGSAMGEEEKIVTPTAGGPVAILGGGAAGLTAAYRLMQAGVPCEIFEASERFGGRIFTQPNFNAENMFCELGGELVDSNHADLIALAGELGLEIQELKADDKGRDLYFFNGKLRTEAEVTPAFRPFAEKLAQDADGLTTPEGEYTEKARKFDETSLEAYLESRSAGVAGWIIHLLRVSYTGEYGRDVSEQSALNLITYLDADTSKGFFIFGESDESKRVAGGSGRLTEALQKAIAGKVKTHAAHRLTAISEAKGDASGALQLTFATAQGARTLNRGRVICTLPFTMLREVDGVEDLPLSVEKHAAIARLGYGVNAKVMYGFTRRWWRDPALKLPEPSNGSVFTDLPFQCVWESSRGQRGESGILTNFIGGSTGRQLTAEHFAKFQEELDEVFPGIQDKFDGRRAMMNWPGYRHAKGSYTCPLVGQYTTLLAAAPTPELDGRLRFAGEHTSGDFSGYMNGAVESGNRVARELLTAPATTTAEVREKV